MDAAAEFEALITGQIPLLSAMGVQVVEASAQRVRVRLPMAGNGNDKGTLFAGAAYSALVIAGWILVMHRARLAGFSAPWAAIVDASCHYAKAIREDCEAVAEFAEAPTLQPGARNWPKVRVTLGDAVAFTGTYACGERKA